VLCDVCVGENVCRVWGVIVMCARD
jgi:hypothetical protein